MYFNLHRYLEAREMRDLLRDRGLKHIDYAVLAELASRAARETQPSRRGSIQTIRDTCFPRVDTLADSLLVAVRTIQPSVQRLVEAGFIRIESISNTRNNRYVLSEEFFKPVPVEEAKLAQKPARSLARSSSIPNLGAGNTPNQYEYTDETQMEPA